MFFLNPLEGFFKSKDDFFLPCVWCKGLKDCMREIRKKVELVWLKQIPHFLCGVGSRLGKTHTKVFILVGPLRGEGVRPPRPLNLKPQSTIVSSSKEKICWKKYEPPRIPRP